MASPKKAKLEIKKLWSGVIQNLRFLFEKRGRLLSFLTFPLVFLKKRFKSRPRWLQLASIYLLVVVLAGAVFVWRSARLRTINPYMDRIQFADPGEALPPERPDQGREIAEQPNPDQAVTAEHNPVGTALEEKAAEAAPVWPVRGREIYREYNVYYNEELACLSPGGNYSFYQGLAIKADAGENVYSILEGEVLRINRSGRPYFGKEVIVKYGSDLKVYYGALDSVYVEAGQHVDCGEIIASVKQNPEGPDSYLYIEMKDKGALIDPLHVLP